MYEKGITQIHEDSNMWVDEDGLKKQKEQIQIESDKKSEEIKKILKTKDDYKGYFKD